jgi:hypothetical protein
MMIAQLRSSLITSADLLASFATSMKNDESNSPQVDEVVLTWFVIDLRHQLDEEIDVFDELAS